MRRGVDPAEAELLAWLGTDPTRLLGEGGEARVFALDTARVVRVHRAGTDPSRVAARTALLDELAGGEGALPALPFAIPHVLEVRERAGRLLSIEARLPGRDMMQALDGIRGEAREALVRSYLEAAARVGDLPLLRPTFGDLIAKRPLRRDRFRDYLRDRAAVGLARVGWDVDPEALARALPEPDRGALVHMDLFPGNVLVEGERVTAVLDFSVVSLFGDRRLDPLAATAYLAPEITPAASARDVRIAREWLASRGLGDWLVAATRWLAAFWCPAVDDARLHGWCRRILLQGDSDPA